MKYWTKISYDQAALLPLIFLCLISIFGAIVYRIYSLNAIGVVISLVLAAVSFFIILCLNKRYNQNNHQLPVTPPAKNWHWGAGNYQFKIISFLLLASYFLLFILCFYILFAHRTTEAIISPWQVAPSYFFIIYGLATTILFFLILKQNNGAMEQWGNGTIFLIILHYLLSFSVALIIYKIGYGFDPFVHQATVDLIDKKGVVEPKPFYYLGQYALIVILHKITALPLVWLDKILVPLVAGLYLPLALFQTLKEWTDDKKIVLLTILMVLILPFSFFIVTTPQNFSYLLLVLVILYGLLCRHLYDLVIIYIFALSALAFHPLAGIPAVLFTLLLTAYHSDKVKLKKYFYAAIFILSVAALPLAFYFINKSAGVQESLEAPVALSNVERSIKISPFTMPSEENLILNFIYLYGFNLKIIIALIAAVGAVIAYRYRQHCKIFIIYLLMSASLFASYLVARKLPFSFLIDYERDNYSERILAAAALFLLPFIMLALYALADKILKHPNKMVKFPLLIFFIVLITTSLYLSYPRFDRYFNSHGFSTSQNDIDAVRWIENNAQSDYIVLANQQVSAAALREFGFKKYYKIQNKKLEIRNYNLEIFYYPVPTGGPLYQYYLDMVYKKPSRETMEAAMDLAGVNEAYFVLNKYWWAFPKVLEEAKLEADTWQEFGKGEVYVFGYSKK